MHHVGIVAELTHDLHHIDALPQCPRLRRSWIAAQLVMYRFFLNDNGKLGHTHIQRPANMALHVVTCFCDAEYFQAKKYMYKVVCDFLSYLQVHVHNCKDILVTPDMFGDTGHF